MKIIVQFEAQLRQVAGTGEQSLDVSEGASLSDAVQQVANLNAGLQERLLTTEGDIQSSVLMFVNDVPVRARTADSHALAGGDRVLFLPPISGG